MLLELAAWYVDVGDTTVAGRVLEAAGDQPEALYWRAYLSGSAAAGGELLAKANALPPSFVLPFRAEIVPPLQWAAAQGPGLEAEVLPGSGLLGERAARVGRFPPHRAR